MGERETAHTKSGDEGGPNGVDAVRERIRGAILRGELAPDARMSQVELARELGISRTPLREALRMIQREGLVEGEARRRLRVAPMSAEDLEDLYALRLSIEALGIRATVPRLSDEDLDELGALLAEMDRLERDADFEEWDEAHRAFHSGLVRHGGRRLARLAVELGEHAERYRRTYLSEPRAWSPARAEHAAILEACRARDADLAATRLVEHLARTALTVAATIAPSYDPQLLRTALRSVIDEQGRRIR